MKLCFNQATTLNNSNLVKDLEYCEKHGYDYIEIRTMDKLPKYLENHSLDDLVQYFQTHHIKPLAFNALVFFNNRSEEEYQEIIKEFRGMLEMGSKLGIEYIVAVPLVTEQKILKSDIHQSCVSVLRELSDLAAPYGIGVAVEFVGHPQCTVNTFGQAYDIVKAVDRANVGLVLDCFHFHAMGSKREDLERADASKIFILHMDDTEDYPIGFLTDEDRVWPGQGAIDLDYILSTIKQKGYSDVASVELFRPEYYELDAEEAIRIAKETTLQVLARHYMLEQV